jgi:hypothetical protein
MTEILHQFFSALELGSLEIIFQFAENCKQQWIFVKLAFNTECVFYETIWDFVGLLFSVYTQQNLQSVTCLADTNWFCFNVAQVAFN